MYACGSGGTAAGLVLGAKLFDFEERGIRLCAVNVCDDRAYFVAAILRICDDAEARWQLGANVTADDLDIIDGYVGAGYARSRPEELATVIALARRDGVVLDPVYTGKAFHALATELGRDRTRFGASVAFIHTGGLFGTFCVARPLGRARRRGKLVTMRAAATIASLGFLVATAAPAAADPTTRRPAQEPRDRAGPVRDRRRRVDRARC